MTIINFEKLFEDALEDLSVGEIEERFDAIMLTGMKVKTRMQIKVATANMSVAIAGRVDEMVGQGMRGGYTPSNIYCDDIPVVMELKDMRITGDTMVHPGKPKKKTGFKGANESHQNILNSQRRKKR